jgi:hypothetical protein
MRGFLSKPLLRERCLSLFLVMQAKEMDLTLSPDENTINRSGESRHILENSAECSGQSISKIDCDVYIVKRFFGVA